MTVGGQSPPATPDANPAALSDVLHQTLSELRHLLRGTGELAAAEARLAASTLALITGLGIAAGVLAVSAWLLLVGALVVLAAADDVRLASALAVAAAANGAAAAGAWLWVLSLRRHLTFPELRSTLLDRDPAESASTAAGPTLAGRP
jgi:hypothetical protein